MKMKKIFSILAAAIIALSFASCENEKGGKYFKITGEVTDSTAHITITPADTSVYYYWGAYTLGELAQYSLDTILAYEFDYVKSYYESYTLEQLEGDVVFKGEYETTFTRLPANFSFVVVAFQVIEGEDGISMGGWDKKIITTKNVKVVGTENLGEFVGDDYAALIDAREDMGVYAVAAANDTAQVFIILYDDDFKGSYDAQDLAVMYGCQVAVNGEVATLVDCSLKGTVNASAGTGTLKGWVLGDNGIKYKLSITYTLPTEEPAPAPARFAAMKGLLDEGAKAQKPAIKRFRK